MVSGGGSLASGDLGAALSDEMSLEVPSLQLAGFDEFGDCPALAGDQLASFPTQVEGLADCGPDHLAGLVKRSTLGLDLGQLGDVRVDEAGLVALEDGGEPGGAHR